MCVIGWTSFEHEFLEYGDDEQKDLSCKLSSKEPEKQDTVWNAKVVNW